MVKKKIKSWYRSGCFTRKCVNPSSLVFPRNSQILTFQRYSHSLWSRSICFTFLWIWHTEESRRREWNCCPLRTCRPAPTPNKGGHGWRQASLRTVLVGLLHSLPTCVLTCLLWVCSVYIHQTCDHSSQCSSVFLDFCGLSTCPRTRYPWFHSWLLPFSLCLRWLGVSTDRFFLEAPCSISSRVRVHIGLCLHLRRPCLIRTLLGQKC